MEKTKVGLVQINNSFSGQNYLPYAAGLLQGYFESHSPQKDAFEFLMPIYCRLPVHKAVSELKEASVVGFSTYVWNIRLSKAIAEALKAQNPDVLIVFGGPQVPDQAESFLREHPFIDLCTHGEAEQTFTRLLENLKSKNWSALEGVSYLDPKGQFNHQPKVQRLKDLNEIPSPFLSGLFDRLMEANPNERWLALWETNRGCPFSCTFCDWGSATQAKVYSFDLERLYRELDWFAEKQIEFIFCCDANFGILKRDLEIVQYAAEIKEKTGYPHALSVQNTKNATERAYLVQKILSDAGLNKGVTISLQSTDKHTLENIKRANISLDSYQELQRRFTRDRVETYSDLILALPGETYDSFVSGVANVVSNGQHNRIQFNNLAILPNAEMGAPEYQKKYGMVSVETKMINIHGSLIASEDEIFETQELVVATDSMPLEDWVRVRAFCWMTALLHFDKILQIPLILIHQSTQASYRELFELFSLENSVKYPILSEVQHFFKEKAKDIQLGGPEYCQGDDFLNIWWPTDEFMLIKLFTENKLEGFYQEAEALLDEYLQNHNYQLPEGLLREACLLNRSLLKTPFQVEDLQLTLSYNLWEAYQAALIGEEVPLMKKTSLYQIDRTTKTWKNLDDWCREVVWYGNKKGAYLYTNQILEPQLAGHY